jgi:hypothetical protein
VAKTVYRLDDEGRKAMEKVVDQGFVLPETPDEHPVLPPDLDELSNSDLMNSFALFSAWADYANAQAGLAVIAERQAELSLEWHVGKYYDDLPLSRRKSVTEAKAAAAQDPDVYEARQKVEEAYAYKRAVSDLAARYERDAAVLSRELSRRSLDAGPKVSRRDRWES